ncbi:alginate lyase family protein [Pseudomonas sp. KU26590]|uniref:alginate lyase family protein n=1 Tax=Pseudomonas sp. KU26590 TaxID=2991051 RepID=UPI00223D2D80|nr:alginate lyase family protein [Pseudomonas sp. KU26590]UZJ59445.1 alginate lyase family protein [Pseudomonas sp. KU26590]
MALLAGLFCVGDVRAEGKSFVHPGMLSTEEDFSRARRLVAANVSPAADSWRLLEKSQYAAATYTPNAVQKVVRGNPSWAKDNYGLLYRDAAAAYQLAVRWKISGNVDYANAAIKILDDWSGHLTDVIGTSDRYLASGLYGYELANAAEIMRTYPGWKNLPQFQTMMVKVFYQMNHDFITNHNTLGAAGLHYWANWDLANLASMMAIGVLVDRHDIYKEAMTYVVQGSGNGAFPNAMWKVYPGTYGAVGLAQVQESGRDQGHSTLDIALIGVICQMAWNQHDDVFGFDNNLAAKASEYVAKYNLWNNVPWTNYTTADGSVQTEISPASRGSTRPMWTLMYNHYVGIRGLSLPYTKKMMDKFGPEAGAYGANSGGFDQLGYGSLLFSNYLETAVRKQ